MSEPRVSVLVTFYNQEDYVDKALQSIMNQKTDFGIRILVGDDGSSDNTCNVVNEWINKYPDIIELHVMDRTPGKHIAGFRASRNRLALLNYVTTEYFIYLDGDDYFDFDGKLQRQVEILDDAENKDCVACAHNIDKLFPDGRRESMSVEGLAEGKYDAKKYWKKLYFHTDTLLIRSSVIPTIDAELLENNFNDNMITFCVIQCGMLYYIPESWAVYIQTGDGIWTSGKLIVNLIRNMFLIDLCNHINPRLKMETTHRFRDTWYDLLKIRKSIKSSELEAFSEEAKDKKMPIANLWIHYEKLGRADKMKLCIRAGWISVFRWVGYKFNGVYCRIFKQR